jgi:hypothetical protein
MLLRGMVGAAGTVLFVYAGELLPSTVRATVAGRNSQFASDAWPPWQVEITNSHCILVHLPS